MSSKEKCTEDPCLEKIRRKLLKLFYHYQYYILLGLFLFFFFPFCSALFRYLLVDSSTKIPSFLTGFNTTVAAKWVFASICILSFFGSLFLTNRQRVVTKKEYGHKCRKSFLYLALGAVYFFFIRASFTYDLEVLIHFHGVTIYFFDALLLIPIYQLISVFIINKENSNDAIAQDTEDGFLVESPISQSEDDRYYRSELAKTLVEKIMHTHNEESSFGIGIVGKWGTGKTSFMRLMNNEVKDKAILFNFRPWVYDNKNSLTYAFFMGLSKALKPYDKSLARDIKFYQSLLNAVDTKFTRLCSALLSRNNNFDAQHQKISQAIKKIGKPIIVMIDDLDRLDEQEIVEVLKLIRNTASFPRTFYVAAYDREYINTAIEKINKCDSNKYLEKIFQYELNLPEYEKSKMYHWMYDKLKDIVSTVAERKQLENALLPFATKLKCSFDRSQITNIREAYRLINMFAFAFSSLKEYVNVIDLLTVEFLKMRYPVDFMRFSKNRKTYLLRYEGDASHVNNQLYNELVDNRIVPEEYKQNIKDIRLDKKYDVDFIKVLASIFNSDYRLFGINQVIFTDRYFRYTIQDDDIDYSQWETYLFEKNDSSSLYVNNLSLNALECLSREILYYDKKKLRQVRGDNFLKRHYDVLLDLLFMRYTRNTIEIDRSYIIVLVRIIINNYYDESPLDCKESFLSYCKKYYLSNLPYLLFTDAVVDDMVKVFSSDEIYNIFRKNLLKIMKNKFKDDSLTPYLITNIITVWREYHNYPELKDLVGKMPKFTDEQLEVGLETTIYLISKGGFYSIDPDIVKVVYSSNYSVKETPKMKEFFKFCEKFIKNNYEPVFFKFKYLNPVNLDIF